MKNIKNFGLVVCSFIVLVLISCNKDKLYDIKKADSVAHFISSSTFVDYYVRNSPVDSFVIMVGTSDVASVDRTVTYNIASTSGAVLNTDYQIISPVGGGPITIPAGSALGSLKIHGNFSKYAGGLKDTLIVTLQTPSIPSAKFKDTLKVVLQRYCDVVPSAFVGDYNTSFDTQAGSPNYGPYTISVVSGNITATGATTGYVIMSNVWDVGGPDIRIDLDWTNPANFTTKIAAQPLYNDPSYGPATITGVGTGTFSSCENKFSLSYKVTVSAGSFGNFITTIAR